MAIETKILSSGNIQIRCSVCNHQIETSPGSLKSFKKMHANCSRKEYVGLGDLVESVTSRIGIPSCSGCVRRRDFLNDKVKLWKRNR
jgi:hypothetical protein